MKIKRYLIFSGDAYYPSGGWEDFDTSFDDLDEVANYIKKFKGEHFKWCHVYDTNTNTYVSKEELWKRL